MADKEDVKSEDQDNTEDKKPKRAAVSEIPEHRSGRGPTGNQNDERRKSRKRPRAKDTDGNKKNRPERKSSNRTRRKDDMPKDIPAPSLNLIELNECSVQELTEMANDLGIESVGALTKQSLVYEILKANAEKSGMMYGGGTLEVLSDGFGFLRSPLYSYLPCPEDIYLSPSQIRRFSLRKGDTVTGQIRPPREKERFFAMIKVETINDEPPETKRAKIPFESLTPLFPDDRYGTSR